MSKLNKITGKIFTGTITSDKMTNTIVVSLDYKFRHSFYQKIVKRHKKLYAENNLGAKVGDLVRICEVRPLSKTKRFTTIEIIK